MLAVVIPCYNERDNISGLVRELEKLHKRLAFTAVFIDDGSRDDTLDLLKDHKKKVDWIEIIVHRENLGFARSLKDGFIHSIEKGFDYIAQMDADLTHPPSLILKMFEALDDADMVIASRYAERGGMKGVPAWRVAISRFGNRGFRTLLGIKTLDATSGYRLSKAQVLKSIDLKEDSFGIQLEATVKTEKAGFTIKEVPFILKNREKGSSKFKVRYMLGYLPLIIGLMRLGRINNKA